MWLPSGGTSHRDSPGSPALLGLALLSVVAIGDGWSLVVQVFEEQSKEGGMIEICGSDSMCLFEVLPTCRQSLSVMQCSCCSSRCGVTARRDACATNPRVHEFAYDTSLEL
jgi:hypothetical protein